MRRFLSATILALVMASPVLAAPSSLSLVVLDPPDANHGEEVTFAVDTNRTDRPWVGVRCNQDGNFVLDGYVGVFPGSLQPDITLDSAYWVSGLPAQCFARLIDFDSGREQSSRTIEFIVSP